MIKMIQFQEIIVNIFYIASVIGIGILGFYSITVYRDYIFKITPRVKVYFENPTFFNEPNIYSIDLVIRNEGEVAVEKATIKFDKKDVFFDKEYSDIIFRNKLFTEGVNLSPKSEFRLYVIDTVETEIYELNKSYNGYEFYRNKNEKITAKLLYSLGKKKYESNIELSFYHLFYNVSCETFLQKINLMKEYLKIISENISKRNNR